MKIDYASLFQAAIVDQSKMDIIENAAYNIRIHSSRYQRVSSATQIPWYIIASIHNQECSLNFNCHLHNGDPLSARTVRVPRGRPFSMPQSGSFPYAWEESAIDALTKSGLWRPSLASNWTIEQGLEFMERYNGLGYANRDINTPYLWSFTSLYNGGLFIADNKFDPKGVSEHMGAVALIKVMQTKGYL